MYDCISNAHLFVCLFFLNLSTAIDTVVTTAVTITIKRVLTTPSVATNAVDINLCDVLVVIV